MIRMMLKEDAGIMAKAFQEQGWSKSIEQYESYFKQQEANQRLVLIIEDDGFCGYLTIVWQSDYKYFSNNHIPEIVDLNVLMKHRSKGYGYQLMKEAETIISQTHSEVGLRVGLLKDYGQAQRLYAKLGYMPDGLGISSGDHHYEYFENALVDDDLVLGYTKSLKVKLTYANMSDIDSWMQLAIALKDNFPGLTDGHDIEAYKKTVIKNIKRSTAICVKEGQKIVGLLLFSRKARSLSCMAVDPYYRRQGIASMMIQELLVVLKGDIHVSTFRADDPLGLAPRRLYEKFGFQAGDLTLEFDYPHQVYHLRRSDEAL